MPQSDYGLDQNGRAFSGNSGASAGRTARFCRTGSATEAFHPGDALLVSVLGAARIRPASIARMAEDSRILGDPEWTPTIDVVAGTVKRALDEGLLEPRSEADGFRATKAGRKRLRQILCRPLPRCSSMGRLCVALKISYADSLPPRARQLVLEDIRNHYMEEISERRRNCADCPHMAAASTLWQEHVTRRIEWELRCLDSVLPAVKSV